MGFRWQFGETRNTRSHTWSWLIWASANWSHEDYNVEGLHLGNYDGDDEFFALCEVNGFEILCFLLCQVAAELVKLGFSRVCVLEEPGLTNLRTQGNLTVPTWRDQLTTTVAALHATSSSLVATNREIYSADCKFEAGWNLDSINNQLN